MRRVFLEMLAREQTGGASRVLQHADQHVHDEHRAAREHDLAAPDPFSFKVLLPAYSDSLPTTSASSIHSCRSNETREIDRIDPIAQRVEIGPDFSKAIRRRP